MIELGHMYGDSGEAGNSKLAHFVRSRLPEDYLLTEADLRWLDECDRSLREPPTNASVTAATKAALTANPKGHIDPFELLIDANICDKKCEPIN
jgi:hypothetical protein